MGKLRDVEGLLDPFGADSRLVGRDLVRAGISVELLLLIVGPQTVLALLKLLLLLNLLLLVLLVG